MDGFNHNTLLRTNKYIDHRDPFYIEKLLQVSISKSSVVRALGRSRIMIHTEIKCGTVVQIKPGKLIDVTSAQFHIAIWGRIFSG